MKTIKRSLNMKGYGIFILVIALILFSTQLVFAGEEYKPYLHKSFVSENPGIEIQGFFDVDLPKTKIIVY